MVDYGYLKLKKAKLWIKRVGMWNIGAHANLKISESRTALN
jgi:hypothetical protein